MVRADGIERVPPLSGDPRCPDPVSSSSPASSSSPPSRSAASIVYDQVLRGDNVAALSLPSAAPERRRLDRDGRHQPVERPDGGRLDRRCGERRQRRIDRRCRRHVDGRHRQPGRVPRHRAAGEPAGPVGCRRADRQGHRHDHPHVERLDDDPDRGGPDRRHDARSARTNRSATIGCAARDSRPTPTRPRRSS